MNYVYADFDSNLSLHPVTKDFVLRTDSKAILQSIRNLVLTAEGEFLQADIKTGGGLRELLFETADSLLAFNLTKRIEDVIKRHEPRVELVNVTVRRSEDWQGVVATITFFWDNSPEPVSEDIKLERLR